MKYEYAENYFYAGQEELELWYGSCYEKKKQKNKHKTRNVKSENNGVWMRNCKVDARVIEMRKGCSVINVT